jgi:hypothetical protein
VRTAHLLGSAEAASAARLGAALSAVQGGTAEVRVISAVAVATATLAPLLRLFGQRDRARVIARLSRAQRLLEEAAIAGPFLPAAPNTVVAVSDLAAIVEAKAADLRAALDDVGRLHQWDVTLRWQAETVLAAQRDGIAAEAARAGGDHRALASAVAAALASARRERLEALRAAIGGFARAVLERASAPETEAGLTVLVERSGDGAIEAALGRLPPAIQAGASADLRGPMPPVSFAAASVQRITAHEIADAWRLLGLPEDGLAVSEEDVARVAAHGSASASGSARAGRGRPRCVEAGSTAPERAASRRAGADTRGAPGARRPAPCPARARLFPPHPRGGGMTESRVLHAYAVVPAVAPVPAAARHVLPDVGVELVAAGPVAAVVSPVPRSAFTEPCSAEVTAARGLGHHAVVAAAAACGPCLPLAYGAVFSSAGPLRAWLSGRAESLSAALAELGSAAEWTATVEEASAGHAAFLETADAELAALGEALRAATQGTAYLLARKRERVQVARRADRLAAVVAQAEGIVASTALLIDRHMAEGRANSRLS